MLGNEFLCSKIDLIDIAQMMTNFPVDKEQINKKSDVSKFRGNQRHYTDKIIQTDNIFYQLETRNLIVGEQRGTDLKGPILGLRVYVFVGKASGYVIGRAVKMGKRDKRQMIHFIHITSETIITEHNIYHTYNHKLINLIG